MSATSIVGTPRMNFAPLALDHPDDHVRVEHRRQQHRGTRARGRHRPGSRSRSCGTAACGARARRRFGARRGPCRRSRSGRGPGGGAPRPWGSRWCPRCTGSATGSSGPGLRSRPSCSPANSASWSVSRIRCRIAGSSSHTAVDDLAHRVAAELGDVVDRLRSRLLEHVVQLARLVGGVDRHQRHARRARSRARAAPIRGRCSRTPRPERPPHGGRRAPERAARRRAAARRKSRRGRSRRRSRAPSAPVDRAPRRPTQRSIVPIVVK